MHELSEYLARVEEIASRARDLQANEASDPKAFSKSVVTDLGELAYTVGELIKRALI